MINIYLISMFKIQKIRKTLKLVLVEGRDTVGWQLCLKGTVQQDQNIN